VEKRLTLLGPDAIESLNARRFLQPAARTRTEAQRDRDRVLYSSAFLRLGHITQVAAPEVGHTFHSRLTHSLKVAQLGRRLAERFRILAARGELDDKAKQLVSYLDPDAVEAAALAHDLGHPPFGHLAEKVLKERSRQFGGFEGNPQSFRIVTRLALRSQKEPGLNLTRRTLNGMLKYPHRRDVDDPDKKNKWGAYEADIDYFDWAREGLPEFERTLEAQLMDWADDVTYAVHDMDDFYRAGLVPLDRLTQLSEELWAFQTYLEKKLLKPPDNEQDDETKSGERARNAERLVAASERLFKGAHMNSIRTRFGGRAEERIWMRALGSRLITDYMEAVILEGVPSEDAVLLKIDDQLRDEVRVLKELIWFYIIERPSLAVIQRGQRKIIAELYDMYRDAVAKSDLHMFPPAFAERVADARTDEAKGRVVTDLIAGMTESSASAVYRQQLGVTTGSLLAQAVGPT
jgi:dGTPase